MLNKSGVAEWKLQEGPFGIHSFSYKKALEANNSIWFKYWYSFSWSSGFDLGSQLKIFEPGSLLFHFFNSYDF